MLGIGVGVIGLMTGIISLFLMAPHANYIRPRSLRQIVNFVRLSILLFFMGVLSSISFFILFIIGIELILLTQSVTYFALCLDLLGWLLLSLGVTALYREWIEGSAELRLKLREKETEIETKAGTGLEIPKPDEIPPFVIDELRKDIKTINQRLEELGIPAGVIKEVKPRKEIPEALKQEIELIQAKIELTRDFYGLEKPTWYFMKLGNFYFESKDYEKAIGQYKAVLEKEPENASALFNRGFAYDEKGDFDKAIEDYDLYLEKINPRSAAAYYNRGLVYTHLGQYERAIEGYNKAIELNPEDVSAMLNLAESYIITKNYSGAHEMVERALNIAEESEDIIMSHFLMVCSSLFQNKKEDAKSQLNRLIDYLETIKDWSLEWDFSDTKQAIESSDVDENAKSLMLSLIELLENKITLDEFKSIFRSSTIFS